MKYKKNVILVEGKNFQLAFYVCKLLQQREILRLYPKPHNTHYQGNSNECPTLTDRKFMPKYYVSQQNIVYMKLNLTTFLITRYNYVECSRSILR